MLTERQLATRKQYVGASEVPAICGVSPFKSSWDIWAEKVGLAQPQPPNEAMQLGLILEPALLDWAHREIAPLKRNVQRVVKLSRTCRLRATLDAVFKVNGHIEPLEVKVGTAYSPRSREWGEPGTDEVPLDVKLQVQAQLMACKAEAGHVLALLPGPRLAHYSVRADGTLQEEIKDRIIDFWKYVEKREPPPDSAPSAAVFHVIERSGDLAKVPADQLEEILSAYQNARAERLKAEKAEQAAKNRLFELAGAACGLIADKADGSNLCVRFVKRTQLRLDQDKVKALIGDEEFLKCKKEVNWYEIKVEG